MSAAKQTTHEHLEDQKNIVRQVFREHDSDSGRVWQILDQVRRLEDPADYFLILTETMRLSREEGRNGRL